MMAALIRLLGPPVDQLDDVGDDRGEVEVLGGVDRDDAGLAQRLGVFRGDNTPTTTGVSPRPSARRRPGTSAASSRCEPESIERPIMGAAEVQAHVIARRLLCGN